MIGNGKDAVEAGGGGEFDDEVHGYGFKREGGAVGCDGAVGNTGSRGNSFGGLTGGAAADKGGDKGLHMGPPVVFSDEEAGFEDTGVACSGGIMV